MEIGLASFKKKHKVSFIELIMIIVLMGIIVASSLPKFTNLMTKARDASNDGIVSALSSKLMDAHSAWVSNGASNAIGGSFIIVDGQQIHVNNFGWPDNSQNVTPGPEDCAIIWNTILSNPPIAGCKDCTQDCNAVANNGCYIASTVGSVCRFTLATNSQISITYNMSNGSVGSTSQ